MGYGEEVNTSDFDSDIRGFDSHYPCSFVYVFAFAGSIPTSPVSTLITQSAKISAKNLLDGDEDNT